MNDERTEWIARCAAEYALVTGLTPAECYAAALECFDYKDDGDAPEYSADEDLACWTDDL